MINTDSIKFINNLSFKGGLKPPATQNYCFGNLPTAIASLFSGTWDSLIPRSVLGNMPQKYDKVVMLFVDAFGWSFFERFQNRFDSLKRFIDEGVVSQLTSQFPSTTAAHVTTMHTGLPVSESGIFEWFYYEPKVGSVIAPLLSSYAGDKKKGTLVADNVDISA